MGFVHLWGQDLCSITFGDQDFASKKAYPHLRVKEYTNSIFFQKNQIKSIKKYTCPISNWQNGITVHTCKHNTSFRFMRIRLKYEIRVKVRVMVFNATLNNISVISWQSNLLTEEVGENDRPFASHWPTLPHNVLSSTPRLSRIPTHNVSGDGHWLYM